MTNTENPQDLVAEIERLKGELANTQQNYINLFENIGDSLFIIDLPTYTIIITNEHATRRFGYTSNELIGLSLDEIEVVDTDPNSHELVWESSFSGTRVYECHYRHRDGSHIPVEVSSRIITRNGRDVIQNFVRNIKIRKQMEAERQQLIEDLDSFAHTVAHDLKNPLSVIVGYAQFLRDTFSESNDTERKEGFDFLYKEGKRAITIVEELLLFASVQRQEEVAYSPLDMYSILSDVKSRLAQMISHHHATLIIPEKWHLALGYAPWVQEIWVNYVSNAIKYGGKPPLIELGSTPQNDGMVRFWVRDNGRGISNQDIPRLFNQFAQLKDMRIDGHGLGLSIVKRIVERLGGQVEAESIVGKGSIFSFTLPTYQA